MKTAMQELKEMLEKLWVNSDVVTIESIIDFMNDYGLEKEKEQLLNAFRDDSWNMSFNEYYNQTYNQNK